MTQNHDENSSKHEENDEIQVDKGVALGDRQSNGRGRTVPEPCTIRRREIVGRLAIRGFTPIEIHDELEKLGIVHPEGHTYTLRTIYRDLELISQTRNRVVERDIRQHRERIRAELREVSRVAWENQDIQLVLKAIKQECELYGINGPIKISQNKKELRATVDDIANSLSIEQLRVFRTIRDQLREQKPIVCQTSPIEAGLDDQ